MIQMKKLEQYCYDCGNLYYIIFPEELDIIHSSLDLFNGVPYNELVNLYNQIIDFKRKNIKINRKNEERS